MKRNRCKYRDTSKGGTARCRNEDMNCYICNRGDDVIYLPQEPPQEECVGFENEE